MRCLCMESSNLDTVHLTGLLISRYILKTMAGGTNSTYYFVAIDSLLGTQIPTTSGSPCLVTDGSTCTFPMSIIAIFGEPSMPLGTANWSRKLFFCAICAILLSVHSTYTTEFEAHFTQTINFLFCISYVKLQFKMCASCCTLLRFIYSTMSWQ